MIVSRQRTLNSLVLFPEELKSDSLAQIAGARAIELAKLHQLSEGLTIRASVYGQKNGWAKVIRQTASHLELQLDLTIACLEPLPIDLVVAVPRPQTQKKILQLAATLGVRSLTFIRSARVEKSYLNSHVLTLEAMREQIALGLGQNMDSYAPKVEVQARFKPYLQDVLAHKLKQSRARLFVADPQHPQRRMLSKQFSRSQNLSSIIFIGPEAGWNEFELEELEKIGACFIDLGPRIMRVETAFVYILAQFSALAA